MIRKSMPSGHDPMGGYRFSLGTNAKRLPGDHAQTKRWSGMTIRGKVIPLQHDPEKWVPVFPRDKRKAFARRSCSNKKMERDDDSRKSHPAPGRMRGRSPATHESVFRR